MLETAEEKYRKSSRFMSSRPTSPQEVNEPKEAKKMGYDAAVAESCLVHDLRE